MFSPAFVCLFVCKQDNSKSCEQILMKFSGNVDNGNNFGDILDYHLTPGLF